MTDYSGGFCSHLLGCSAAYPEVTALWKVTQRSSDFSLGLPNDVFQFAVLLHLVCRATGDRRGGALRPGSVTSAFLTLIVRNSTHRDVYGPEPRVRVGSITSFHSTYTPHRTSPMWPRVCMGYDSKPSGFHTFL